MREYQRVYIENLKEIIALNEPPEKIPEDAGAFLAQRRSKAARIREIIDVNTALLRQKLFPVLDDIVSAGEEEVRALADFTAQLGSGVNQLDLVLSYHIHSALVVYARKWNKRDMLIEELYQTAMALFYMQEIVGRAGKNCYHWKMGLLFGEAAAYIKRYDEIEDPKTRGYIHRSMANLALSYSGVSLEEGQRKLAAIRRSLQILEDPSYHARTPSLPWELFIYKSHQERTTALGLLRASISDPQILREVMESAEYVRQRQLEDSRKRGGKPLVRWQAVYEAAQYHCGIKSLPELLRWMEKTYLEGDRSDYSEDGVYCNLFLPALYADYLSRNEEYKQAKKEVLSHMYRQMVRYVKSSPQNQLDGHVQLNLISCLWSFVEYPDGIQQKDFMMQLVVCRNPDAYVVFRQVAEITVMMARHALETRPELLLGVLGCENAAQLREKKEEVCRFAYESGMLHDVGTLVFDHMTRRIGRGWLEEEKETYQYHVYAGALMLDRSESTRPYRPAALGHHRNYDGSGGYPEDYDRMADPNRAVTDMVSAAALLVELMDDLKPASRRGLSLEHALEEVRRQAGTRLSPDAASLLLELEGPLREYLRDARIRAYEEAFQMLRG